MTLEEVAEKLKDKSSKTARGWTPDDTHGDETYGLNFTRILEVARGMKTDAVLADELYASTNHDMKVLATVIDDPKSYTLDELYKRTEQLYPSPFAEKFCRQVLAQSDHAVHFINEWIAEGNDAEKAFAYYTLGEVAKLNKRLSDDFFANYLDDISDNVHQESDFVKESMHWAIKSICARDACLNEKCAEVARKIGALRLSKGKVLELRRVEKMMA